MQPIRRRALDRRAFLRGSGACLALPLLDAMVPAFSKPPQSVARALFVFVPNGVCLPQWRGEQAATMQPMQPLAGRFTVYEGLAIDGGRSHGDGPGDHARAVSSFLTCAHPRKTGGADIHVGVSVDQRIAQQVGGATAFRSLELGMERGRAAGVCDSGYSCAYSNNVSWQAADRPVAKETDPRNVFSRLFGDPKAHLDREAQARRMADDRSVLDLVSADAKSLQRQLGPTDRGKLDQYLDSVRELELRLWRLPDAPDAPPIPEGLMDDGSSFAERLRMMYELMSLALATDRTRVITLMLGNGGSDRSYRFLGVPDGHHSLSHHGKSPEKLQKIGKIDRFHVEQFAGFLQRLAAHPDGERDLLANSLVVYGSGIGDGNRHNHTDLPVMLCGEGVGAATGRGLRRFERETPMANLYLAVMRAMGCKDPSFADSTAALDLRA